MPLCAYLDIIIVYLHLQIAVVAKFLTTFWIFGQRVEELEHEMRGLRKELESEKVEMQVFILPSTVL